MPIFIYCVVLALFILPKINIIDVGGFNAGLRIDDGLILMMAALIFGTRMVKHLSPPITNYEKKFFIFLCLITVGTLISSLGYNRGTILFPIRFAEYFVFFYIGKTFFAYGLSLKSMLTAVFAANVTVALLQYAHVIGGFTVRGYKPDVSERIVGITSGPWELGVLLNFICCYFLVNDKSSIKKYSILVIATLVILLNGSRMSLVAQAAITLAYFTMASSIASVLKKSLALIPIVLIAIVLFEGSEVSSRSESLASWDNVETLISTYDDVQVKGQIPSWDELGTLKGGDLDTSWSMRGVKWIYAIKLFLSSPIFMVFGVGSGAFGNALDGGWLRILTEWGIIGSAAFVMFLLLVKKLNATMRLMMIAFAVNMLMIDIYMSYKVMSVIMFCTGYYYMKQNKARRTIATNPAMAKMA
ncbi:hypothetical protein D3C85_749570 [compost metagenome]